MDKNKLLFLV